MRKAEMVAMGNEPPQAKGICKEKIDVLESPHRVAIETHGCKLNQADSQALASRFVKAGYRLVSPQEEAEVYVINTCTVTHVADAKARQTLRAARRRTPRAMVVATGCYAQRAPNVLKDLEGVDLVVRNTEKESLVQQVLKALGVPAPFESFHESSTYLYPTLRTRAMVKIQEGCNQVCAYCIVPKVRGREQSIPPEVLLQQIRGHLAAGYREVVLTGTQLGSYGFDLSGATLERLIGRILEETLVERLRVSSLQPQELSDELLALWSDGRLCPHFHLPLQSGSDAALRRMRRRYTAAGYAQGVEQVRCRVSEAAITADVIVGFPGETEQEFEETYTLCQQMKFAGMHLFPYSSRPGTSAAYLKPQVAGAVKRERMKRLLELSASQARLFRERQLGSIRPVLWEAPRQNGSISKWTGLTDTYIQVYTESPLPLANHITPARLEEVEGDLIRARLLP